MEVSVAEYLGCIENIFRVQDKIGHEIVLLQRVEFPNPEDYQRDKFELVNDGDRVSQAYWVSISDFISGACILHPGGLAELLRDWSAAKLSEHQEPTISLFKS